MKEDTKITLIAIFMVSIFMIGVIQVVKHIIKQHIVFVNFKEYSKKLKQFQNNPHNKGRYIMDFETETWYDIDGFNPNVPPLRIDNMSSKNIRERVLGQK